LDYFMYNYDNYFNSTDHGLNVKEQLPNFVKWLVQAEILDNSKNKKITQIGELLIKIYEDNPNLVWQIIWINLVYNSPIANWYSQNIGFDSIFQDEDLRELVKQDYPTDSPTTIKNILYALSRTFKESPIGENLGQQIRIDKSSFTRKGTSDIEIEAVAYSIYKYASVKNSLIIKVSDFYRSDEKMGVYKEFGIQRNELLKKLRSLSMSSNRVLIAELNMGLEHITLREDLTEEKVLQILFQ